MRRTTEQWKALLEAQQASGMSMAAFCRKQSLCKKTFYYWHRKLAKESLAGNAFVQVVPPPKQVSVCTLRMGSAELVLGEVSPSWLAALMRALA